MCASLAPLERFTLLSEPSVYILSTARVPAPKGLQSSGRRLTPSLKVYSAEIVHTQKHTSAFTELAPGQHVRTVDLQIQR